jgi:hypothetical protein
MRWLEDDVLGLLHASARLHVVDMQPGNIACLLALHPSVAYVIPVVRGLKSARFGEKELFFANVAGP